MLWAAVLKVLSLKATQSPGQGQKAFRLCRSSWEGKAVGRQGTETHGWQGCSPRSHPAPLPGAREPARTG